MQNKPPPGSDPAQLFATLSERCPIAPLDIRLAAAPDVPLYARAVRGSRIVQALRARAPWQILIAALWTDDAPVFTSAQGVRQLEQREYKALLRACEEAHLSICPTYALSDTVAWKMALTQGLQLNGSILVSMYNCFDASGGGLTMRPDRYWGMPSCDLLDGHMMIFSVVLEWMNQRRGK